MDVAKRLIRQVVNRFARDSLYHNSMFLMSSTAVMAITGFLFWTVCTHLYTPHQVGIATTLISAISLISTISLFGYNNALIRFFSDELSRAKRINTSLTLVTIASMIISLLFLGSLSIFSPKLLFLQHNIWLALMFVISAAVTTDSTIFDSIFVASRRASFVFTKNSIMSILKVIIPFVLIGLGASGIFLASTLSFAIACLIGIIILTTKLKHIIKLQFDKVLAKQMRRFSVENYLATFIEGLSISLLPILITNRINANISGYFYIDTMIINALYVIPSAISQVLFAEGSSKEQSLAGIYKKALKFIYIFMVPAIILLILCGRYILEIFGESFATYGYGPLVLFSLAGIPVAAKLLTNAIFNIERKVILVIITDIITVSIVMSISYILLPKGLVWVGVAWVIGESIGALVALALLLFKSNTLESHPYRRKLLQLYELARQ